MRARIVLIGMLVVLGVFILFMVFIALRGDVLLVQALSAAGTVAAGVFAAIAALASLRAADSSRAAADRTRLAAASAIQPRLRPVFEEGRGIIRVTGSPAIEVNAVWQVEGAQTVTAEEPRIEPGEEFPVALPEGDLAMLWVEYRDASGAFRWQDTWDADLRRLSSALKD
jgi:hypothetical protein